MNSEGKYIVYNHPDLLVYIVHVFEDGTAEVSPSSGIVSFDELCYLQDLWHSKGCKVRKIFDKENKRVFYS